MLSISDQLPPMKRAKLCLPKLTRRDVARYNATFTPTGDHRPSGWWRNGGKETTAGVLGVDIFWVKEMQHPSLKVPESSLAQYTPAEVAKLNGDPTFEGSKLAQETSLVDGDVSRLAEMRVRRNDERNRLYQTKTVDEKLANAVRRIDRARSLEFRRRLHGEGLRLVQKTFIKACQEDYGIVPLGDSFDTTPTPGMLLGKTFDAEAASRYEASHGECIYCNCHCPDDLTDRECHCPDDQADGEEVQTDADILKQCEHCRYYKRSHARRCFGKFGNRSGSIAYILRHSSLHDPESGAAPVDEHFISAVTAAFQKYPVSSEPGEEPERLSALSTEYEQWIEDTNMEFRWLKERESMARWFNTRQRRNFLIMTQTFGFDDAVFWDTYGGLTSIIKAATWMMDVHHNIPSWIADQDPCWYHRTRNLAAMNMKARHSIRPNAMQLSFTLPKLARRP